MIDDPNQNLYVFTNGQPVKMKPNRNSIPKVLSKEELREINRELNIVGFNVKDAKDLDRLKYSRTNPEVIHQGFEIMQEKFKCRSESTFSQCKSMFDIQGRGLLRLEYDNVRDLLNSARTVMHYIPLEDLFMLGNEKSRQQVMSYDPDKEFVVMMVCGVKYDKKSLREKDPKRFDCMSCVFTVPRDCQHRMPKELVERHGKYNGYINPKGSVTPDKVYMCTYCKKRMDKMKRCSACKVIGYCSVECQRGDWPEHKTMCDSFKSFNK